MKKVNIVLVLIFALVSLPVLADDKSFLEEKIAALKSPKIVSTDTKFSLRSDTEKLLGIWEVDSGNDGSADIAILIKEVSSNLAGRRFIYDRVSVADNSAVLSNNLVGHFINNRMYFAFPFIGSTMAYAVKINSRATFGIGTELFNIDLSCDLDNFPNVPDFTCSFEGIQGTLSEDVRMTKK